MGEGSDEATRQGSSSIAATLRRALAPFLAIGMAAISTRGIILDQLETLRFQPCMSLMSNWSMELPASPDYRRQLSLSLVDPPSVVS